VKLRIALSIRTLIADEESMLTDSGRSEHFELGRRFKKRLPDLMGGSYQPGSFVFRHTHKVGRKFCQILPTVINFRVKMPDF
jgi:hypothetical protein